MASQRRLKDTESGVERKCDERVAKVTNRAAAKLSDAVYCYTEWHANGTKRVVVKTTKFAAFRRQGEEEQQHLFETQMKRLGDLDIEVMADDDWEAEFEFALEGMDRDANETDLGIARKGGYDWRGMVQEARKWNPSDWDDANSKTLHGFAPDAEKNEWWLD